MMQELVESIKKLIDSEINEIHTVLPGKIVSYDAGTGLATVLPTMKFKTKEGTVDYPQITGVPVVFPQCSNQEVSITYPIKPNDGCLIFIAEHSIEYWLYGQETDTALSFDLTDAFCIPGLFPKANPNLDKAIRNNAVIISNRSAEFIVRKDKVEMTAPDIVINGNVRVNGTLSAEGEITSDTESTVPDTDETGGSEE